MRAKQSGLFSSHYYSTIPAQKTCVKQTKNARKFLRAPGYTIKSHTVPAKTPMPYKRPTMKMFCFQFLLA